MRKKKKNIQSLKRFALVLLRNSQRRNRELRNELIALRMDKKQLSLEVNILGSEKRKLRAKISSYKRDNTICFIGIGREISDHRAQIHSLGSTIRFVYVNVEAFEQDKINGCIFFGIHMTESASCSDHIGHVYYQCRLRQRA